MPSRQERIRELERQQAEQSKQIDDLERRAKALNDSSIRQSEQYRRAQQQYDETTRTLERARERRQESADTSAQVQATYEDAATRWRWVTYILIGGSILWALSDDRKRGRKRGIFG